MSPVKSQNLNTKSKNQSLVMSQVKSRPLKVEIIHQSLVKSKVKKKKTNSNKHGYAISDGIS